MNGGTRSFEMARRMVAAGHEVHMITSVRDEGLGLNEDKDGWRYSNEDGIHVHWLHVPYDNKMTYRQRIKSFLSFALKAGDKAIDVGGDVVFATSTPLTIAIPAVKAKKKLQVPMVFEVRDLWPELPIAIGAIKSPILKWLAKKLEKYAYFNAEYIIGLSPGMSEGVTKLGYPSSNVFTIPNSCDLDIFDPSISFKNGEEFRRSHSWLGERPLVLYAGTMGHINGVSYLVDLAHEVLKISPEVRFLVVGGGVDEDKVRSRAIELGVLDKNFFMLGHVPKSSIPALFSAATVSCSLFIDLPEMWANSANKFFDTLAAGKPIVINYKGWQADIIEKYNNGIVLPPKVDSFTAQRLIDLLQNKEQLVDFSNNSRFIAETLFSRDVLAKELISILEKAHKEHLVDK